MNELTLAEKQAIQQLTGMHYSEGKNIRAACIGMGLEKEEWENIKSECEWFTQNEIVEIENYLNK